MSALPRPNLTHPSPPSVHMRMTQTTSARIPTADGEFQLVHFRNNWDDKEHLALVMGNVTDRPEVLVRIHSECFTGDVLGSQRCDCGEQLAAAMRAIAAQGSGVIVYLRQEGRGIGLAEKLRAYNLQDQGYDTVDANLLLGHQADERDYTPAVLILQELGVRSIRLLTNNPAKVESLESHHLPVVERVAMQPNVNRENAAYLRAKVHRMRHLLDLNGHLHAEPEAQPPTALAYGSLLTSLAQRAAAHHQRTGHPFVTLSYAQSLDGCVAGQPGKHLDISAPLSLTMTHALRAAHDGILVGIGTALADDPSLTVRRVEGDNPQPVVVDSHLRLPATARLLQMSRGVWIATTDAAPLEPQQALEAAGAQILRLPTTQDGRVDLGALLACLGKMGMRSLMVEGGPSILTSFLAARLADYAVVTVAPFFVGGVHAVNQSLDPSAEKLPRIRDPQIVQVGPDVTLWGALA
ncbi:MAG: GTP cyclohydrolase II [Chloroflexi bacterium]|nr:GTP cyclohydrolase II [Chloroflexota bacterium]